jgi:hypothetical protein
MSQNAVHLAGRVPLNLEGIDPGGYERPPIDVVYGGGLNGSYYPRPRWPSGLGSRPLARHRRCEECPPSFHHRGKGVVRPMPILSGLPPSGVSVTARGSSGYGCTPRKPTWRSPRCHRHDVGSAMAPKGGLGGRCARGGPAGVLTHQGRDLLQ